jgi:metal-responsive CopG/Arc/MetJ family transcriptional regulator
MGTHKAGLVAIGAFVDDMLCDYIDKVAEKHGFSTRSDAIRAIISEHQAVFSNKIDRNTALTPLEVDGNDNPQGSKRK